jgi:hypothetical protein
MQPTSRIDVRRAAALLLFLAGNAFGDSFDFRALATVRAGSATGPASWMEGEWGRFDYSGETATASVDASIDWNPVEWFGAHVHGVARAEPSSYRGDAEPFGLVQGFLELRNTSEKNRLQLRAGQFFLPTSRENKDLFWTSPYSISYSALNSWMGQEVRPVGVDLEYRYTNASFNSFTVGATAFQNNDTMGTLLAWRGWSVGSRLPVYDELVPLPPLWSLPVFIPAQNREGTTPFRNDLDGITGWAARARFTHTDRALLQVTYLDNRGDHLLYGDEYSWKTDFIHAALEIGQTESTVFAAEAVSGYTAMGPLLTFTGNRAVVVEFLSAYGLLSHKTGRNRFTGRMDWFELVDEDGSRGENSTEDGLSWTLAWLFDLTPHIRTALEFTQVTGDSTLAAESGFDPSTDARRVLLEVRYLFW